VATFLVWAVIIGLIAIAFKYPHWFRRNVTYRKQYLDSLETRKRYNVATKNLSQKELFDLIAEKLPDTHTSRGAIVGVPAKGDKPAPYTLHFALLGAGVIGQQAMAADGKKRPYATSFAVVISRKQEEAVATFVITKWTEVKGIFKYIQDVTSAQDKLLAIMQTVDPKAEAFTEG